MTKEKEKGIGYIIKEGIRDMFYIWKEELKHIGRDSGVMVFFFLVPFMYPVLYAFIYNNNVVRNAKMVVVDDSRSPYSREFARNVNGTPDVQIVKYCANIDEARRMLDEKKAYGILYFPSEFSDDLHSGRQATVTLFSDMSCLLYYKNFLLSATEVSLAMGKQIALADSPASTRKLANIKVNPVLNESVALFNPLNGFASFLVPAILVLVIQQTLILGICMLGGTEREKNRFRMLIPVSRHFHGTLRIVFGKALAYLMLYMVVCCWVLVIVPYLFDLPQLAEGSTLILFFLPYLFACIFFAMALSGFAASREAPMVIFVFTSVVLLFISGVSWPLHAIRGFWRVVAYIFPSTAGIQGFIGINSMGATLNEVAFDYKLLWVQAGVYFLLACLVYRYQIIRSRKLLMAEYKRLKAHTPPEEPGAGVENLPG